MSKAKKIFIASSSEARSLAEALNNYIRSQKDPVETIPWWGRTAFRPSENTLDELLGHCERCDFAVVLLTTDDFTERRGTELQSPRDNTIFELGLFMGALGLDPSRCFMISGVNREALPSDLRGRTYIQISQPKDLRDRDACYTAIEDAGWSILQAIQNASCYERPKLPVIASDVLGEMERAKKYGGNLVMQRDVTTVVVNSVEPVEETDTQFAQNVMENLRAGAKYEYFWGNFEDNDYKTMNFVQAIAIAGLCAQVPEDPIPLMQEHLAEVRKNLSCMQKRLSIHFRKRPPLQFCVHNALSEKDAACYLRHESGFVRWTSGRGAKEIATELTGSCKTKNKEDSIFHSTVDFKLREEAGSNGADPKIEHRTEALRRLMQTRFPPELHAELDTICFGS